MTAMRLVTTLTFTLIVLVSTLTPAGAEVVERFAVDPLSGIGRNHFFAEGDTGARFEHLSHERPHFPGDRPGSLRVIYDTTLPAARIATPIGDVLSMDDDFEFGAILTIRSDGFHASHDGFSQISFGLWNSQTTGFNRTGFPSDSYDLVEFDYFPNIGEIGGPFLSPSVFGGNAGDNAFFNFAFLSSETALPFDTPLICSFRYDCSARKMTMTVSAHRQGIFFEPVPGGTVTFSIAGINPTFLIDSLGIAAYFEGFKSLRAVVDFDLIYFNTFPGPFRSGPRRFTR